MRLIVEARLSKTDAETVIYEDGMLAVVERRDCSLAQLILTLAPGRVLLPKVQAELVSSRCDGAAIGQAAVACTTPWGWPQWRCVQATGPGTATARRLLPRRGVGPYGVRALRRAATGRLRAHFECRYLGQVPVRQQVVDGRGQVVTLPGEPGAGKSRLCVWLQQRLQTAAPHAPLRYDCLPHGQTARCTRSCARADRRCGRTP